MGAQRLRLVVAGTVTAALLATLGLVAPAAADPGTSRDGRTAQERRAHGEQIAPEREETPAIPSSAAPVRLPAATPAPTPTAMPPGRTPRPVRWPSAGTSTLNARPGLRDVSHGAVSLGRSAQARTGADGHVKVQVFGHAKATKAGVEGVLLRMSRATAASDDAPVDVSVDYSEFAGAFGGDWAQRLRLMSLPACALTTPEVASCRKQTPVESSNDVESSTVSAKVSVQSASVLAVSAAAAGTTGNWGATPLAASSTWNVSEQTGAFNWSYPLRVPPSLGGPSPELSIGYSASSIDGKVASTNNQTSWLGDGWDMSTGFIERKYTPCATDKTGGNNASLTTGDQCWISDNATLAFSGHGGELVKDAASGAWRLKEDDGTRVQRLTGGFNDDNDGEYWLVTTPDGTQYYFGRGRRSSTDTLALNSAWSMPVFGNQAGEPCYNAAYASAFCNQAWRWNLDYVVDPSGNTMTYVYTPETNKYGRNNNQAVSTYTRGGYVSRIEYGQRAGTESASPAPTKVDFGVSERCLPSGAITCDPAQLTAANAASWPDVPFDQICAATTCPNVTSPAFFTRKRLTSVTASVMSGGSYKSVDSWTFKHTFPDPGDATSPALFMSSITHAGTFGTAITLPDVTFVGTQMANRVDKLGDYGPPMNRYRISSITTESGATTSINYTPPDCTTASLPASPDSNTRRCFPVRWTPAGQVGPVVEYFHKYLVSSIVENSNDAVSLPIETYYSYLGTPAWHYDDNPLERPAERTWSEFRGYDTVDVITGAPSATVRSQDRTRYFRGMHGDKLANGTTRTVTVDGIADVDRLNGFEREQISYNGVGGAEVTGQVSTPWISPATATGTDGTTATYRGTGTTDTRVIAPALPGGKRASRNVTTYDNTYGMPTQVDDQGDISTAADDRCTRLEYVRNATAWILGAVKRSETVGVACAATPTRPADVLDDNKMSYDGLAYGAAPTRGLTTKNESLKSYSGSTPVYLTQTTTVFDAVGRPTSVTDTLGRSATTAYTPATTGPLTSVTTTAPDPDGTGPKTAAASTTTVNPAWGSALKVTDPNGKVTSATFDALGRTTAVWQPGRAQASATANATYAYTVSRTAPNTVTTNTLDANETYRTSVELYDGLLRPRQTQSPSASDSNPGRLVTDTVYDSRGLVSIANGQWFTTGTPSRTTVYSATAVPARTRYTYDGAGRTTAEIFDVSEQERWRTTTTFGGDRVSVDPPTGGTPTTSITDGRGQVTELRQYLGTAPTGTYQAATYAFDRGGNLTKTTDAAGNVWTYGYDLRGLQTSSADPDKSATSTVYDDAGQVTSTTDAKGATLAYVRDPLGRPTELRDSSATGTLRSSWSYDTLAKGQITSSTRYVKGAAYTTAVTGYNDSYQPTGQALTIPTAEGALAGTYTTGYDYAPDGQLWTVDRPAVGGLDAESDNTYFDSLGMPEWMSGGFGTGVYVADTLYDAYGQTLRYDLGNTYAYFVNFAYETGTQRLSTSWVERENGVGRDKDVAYTYDTAGNPTAAVDKPTSKPIDAQCYKYDGLRRLSSAWTPASGNCAPAPTTAGLGGPAPYWKDYTFDAAGNRKTEVSHATAGDTTQTYAYPASGPTSVRPHAVTSVTQSGVGGAATSTYGYDAVGDTTARNRAGKPAQTLTWDAEQRLTSVTEGSTTAGSYIYTADGDRLIRKQNGVTTAYLPGGTELTLTAATGNVTATRYYAFNGQTIAMRTGNSAGDVSTLVSDTQSTAQLSINNGTSAVTQRRTDPYGNLRGTKPAWAGDHGFLDKPTDLTGLTQVGARYYDATLGKFVSVDPVMDMTDPGQWTGYSYSENNPIAFSDPSGLWSMPKWAKNAVKATKGFVKKYQAEIVGGVAGFVVGAACMAVTAGAGSIGCAALAGAVGGAVTNLWKSKVQKTQKFSWGSLVKDTVFGAATGAAFAGGGMLAGRAITAVAGKVAGGASSSAVRAVAAKVASRGLATAEGKASGVASKGAQQSAKQAEKSAVKDVEAAVCSFSGATPILMADGTTRSIEDIQIGDMVVAEDAKTGEKAARPVYGVVDHQDVLVDLEISGRVVTTTTTHPFWSVTDGRFEPAGELSAGERVRAADGRELVVGSFRARTSHVARAYNLAIREYHSYFVGVDSVLVHNTGASCSQEGRNALGQFTGDNAQAAAGRSAHKNYGTALGADDSWQVNEHLPDSLLRPDAFSQALMEIRELKPNSPSGIRLGTTQLQGYVDHMNSITPGGGWRGVLDTYQP